MLMQSSMHMAEEHYQNNSQQAITRNQANRMSHMSTPERFSPSSMRCDIGILGTSFAASDNASKILVADAAPVQELVPSATLVHEYRD